MQLPNKRKVVCYGVLLALVMGASFIVYKRAGNLKDCIAAKYDLRRETNFRWLTGACTTTGKDGGQVYVSQLRAFGSDDHHDVDVDHGN